MHFLKKKLFIIMHLNVGMLVHFCRRTVNAICKVVSALEATSRFSWEILLLGGKEFSRGGCQGVRRASSYDCLFRSSVLVWLLSVWEVTGLFDWKGTWGRSLAPLGRITCEGSAGCLGLFQLDVETLQVCQLCLRWALFRYTLGRKKAHCIYPIWSLCESAKQDYRALIKCKFETAL